MGLSDTEQIDIDVLVVGAGGCGLTAALAAHAHGADVAVLEKSGKAGGNTALSSGSIPAANTDLQRACGIADSPDAFATDLFDHAGSHDADELVPALTAISADLISFLTGQGVTLELISDYRHVAHRTHRLHAPPSRRGEDLIDDLLAAVNRCDIPLAIGQAVNDILVEDECVVGVSVNGDNIRAGAVILACNGFAAAPTLLANHCPNVAKAAYGGSPHSTGDGLAWGAKLNAATGNMGAYQAHAGLSVRTGALMTWTLIERGAIIVDGRGCRFADETLGYSGFADEMLAHKTGPFFLVFDDKIKVEVAKGQPDFAKACQMGAAFQSDAPDTLAQIIGIDPAQLSATMHAAQQMADGKGQDPFGRTSWGNGPLGNIVCAAEIQPALFHTQGGLAINADAQVLSKNGASIPGLYAGGGAAMGISGLVGGRGYASGNGLLSALGLGLIAGRNAATQAQNPNAMFARGQASPPSITL